MNTKRNLQYKHNYNAFEATGHLQVLLTGQRLDNLLKSLHSDAVKNPGVQNWLNKSNSIIFFHQKRTTPANEWKNVKPVSKTNGLTNEKSHRDSPL